MCVGQLNRQRDFPSSNQYLIYKKEKKENHLKYKTAIIFITFFSLRCLETIVRVINERCWYPCWVSKCSMKSRGKPTKSHFEQSKCRFTASSNSWIACSFISSKETLVLQLAQIISWLLPWFSRTCLLNGNKSLKLVVQRLHLNTCRTWSTWKNSFKAGHP